MGRLTRSLVRINGRLITITTIMAVKLLHKFVEQPAGITVRLKHSYHIFYFASAECVFGAYSLGTIQKT